jgi:predicted RNase H-like HicB family nuclease
MTKYLIVLEETSTGFSAYSPDIPGCVATGRTRDDVEREMHDAISLHIEGLQAAGLEVPRAVSSSAYVEVAA